MPTCTVSNKFFSSDRSLVQHQEATGHTVDFVGKLLQMGGTLESRRVGGPDHAPVFAAVARWKDLVIEAEGSTKKNARQAAARECVGEGSIAGVNIDYVGKLLQMGGSVESRRAGGSDHQPVFEAVARLAGVEKVAQRTTKRRAQAEAARMFLE
jgi:hypothetical protein